MFRHNLPNSNHNNTFLRYDKASVKQKGTENRLPRGWRKIFNACKCDFLICTHLLLGELSFFSSCSIRHNGCLSFLQSRYENIHYTVHMRVCIYYNASLLCWR